MKPIILASTSPRRKELLSKLGIKFKAVSSNYEEDMTLKLPPLKLAKFLSAGKARAVAESYRHHIIIGADTFVALGQEVLGKPHTPTKATQMLQKISGKTVSIITGLTVIDTATNQERSIAKEAKIYIKKLSNQEIINYIKTKEPLDKAGAFAIQGIGAAIIRKIDGDFFSIIGLPIFELIIILNKFGVKII